MIHLIDLNVKNSTITPITESKSLVKQIARDFKCRFDSKNVIQAKN